VKSHKQKQHLNLVVVVVVVVVVAVKFDICSWSARMSVWAVGVGLTPRTST